ncbi:MAG: hypothetical protein WCK76_11285 [Elusimicrobiota bacterium]
MPEEKKPDVPLQLATPPEAPEAELRAELERERARGRMFKASAAVLGVVCVIVAAVAFSGYRKVMQANALLEGVAQGFQPLGGQGGDGIPAPLRAMPLSGSGEANMQDPLNAILAAGSSSAPVSGLGLLSMPDRGEAGPEAAASQVPDAAAAADAKKLVRAMSKYADRPIVKDFLAELAKDKDYMRAKAAQKDGNPLVMLANIQKSPGLRELVTSYSKRPDFMPLMMEVMQDPEMRPFMRGMPGKALPSLPPAPVPAPAARAQPASRQPAAAPAAEGEMTFDPSAISGSAAPAYSTTGKAPPPVDSGKH